MGCLLVVRSVFGLVQTCVADDERSWPQTSYVGSTCRTNPSCPIQCRSPLLSIVPPKTAKGLKTNPRKKKTVSELKQEENSLLMDKAKLIEELEALQDIRKDLMLKNERLKKQKLNLDSQLAVKSSGKTNSNHHPPVLPVKTANAASNPPQRVVFEIPDLNSVPTEEES